jgi:hypothetical protein
MWLRGGVNCEARTWTVWNVPAHEKFWRPLQHHVEAGEGNFHYGDNATDSIHEGRFQIVRSTGARRKTPGAPRRISPKIPLYSEAGFSFQVARW